MIFVNDEIFAKLKNIIHHNIIFQCHIYFSQQLIKIMKCLFVKGTGWWQSDKCFTVSSSHITS